MTPASQPFVSLDVAETLWHWDLFRGYSDKLEDLAERSNKIEEVAFLGHQKGSRIEPAENNLDGSHSHNLFMKVLT